MKPNLSKYRLVLGGDLINGFHPDTINKLIRWWAEESGVPNVSSGCIRCDVDSLNGVIIASSCVRPVIGPAK